MYVGEICVIPIAPFGSHDDSVWSKKSDGTATVGN